ncbi:MAG TPA: TlpA family protein disulfide reductase [Anaerolineae bacterium]|nr:TlpA family protein disulfide reductase [Anaerolineae bacterium]HIP69811.1 TlpA family protein disulfide reductase [Anaerolineae bacterium]
MQTFLKLLQDSRRWTAVLIIVGILGIGWIGLTAVPSAATTGGLIPSPRAGFLAPDFTLETTAGEQITLSDLRGQVVVINLWTSWCPPCRAEMPAIESVYQANKDDGLEVLAVNSTFQDDPEAAAQFARDFGLTFPILLDMDGAVSRRYQLQALPTTFFVDRQGVIREVVPGGPMKESLIQSKVADLLAEEVSGQ